MASMHTPVTIKKNPRAKRMSITVRPDGTVTVTQPRFANRLMMTLFIRSRREWIEEKVAYFREHPTVAAPKQRNTRKEYLQHKETARTLVQERLEYFNAFYNFYYKTVSIKNLKTRWGSCSSKKNLNFNYRIIFLSKDQQDYVIVHELCHLAEMNHGPRFWTLVAQKIPAFKELRRSVRKFDL